MAKQRDDSPGGIVVVDKPGGMTSHDVVSRLRRVAHTRRVGHGGTLDPMATGVLVIATGKATRLLTFLLGADKEYVGTVRLGAATDSDDADGTVTSQADASLLTDDQIHAALGALTGPIMQAPSKVSTIKIDGKRAHQLVREGAEVELAPRPVTVHSIDVTTIAREGPFVDVTASFSVSTGTYIRAIARDLGEALQVGGHLTALRRTRVGDFVLAEAHALAALESGGAAAGSAGHVLSDPDDNPLPLIPLAQAARLILPSIDLSEADAASLGYGQSIQGSASGPTAAIGPTGTLVAVVVRKGDALSPQVVFAPSGA